MNRRTLLFAPLLLYAALAAEQDLSHMGWSEMSFNGGLVVRVYTRLGGLSMSGTFNGKPGQAFTRVFTDQNRKNVFGYEAEVSLGSIAHQFTIRLKPLSQKDLEVHHMQANQTFAEPRLIDVKEGETATVDVLSNPKTGEKVSDIIEVSIKTPEQLTAEADRAFADGPANQLRIYGPKVWVNGKLIENHLGGGVTGRILHLYVPGKGGFAVVSEDPKREGFVKSGWINGNRLTINWGGDRIEFDTDSSILPKATYSDIWVKLDPNYRTKWLKDMGMSPDANIPDGVTLAASDGDASTLKE